MRDRTVIPCDAIFTTPFMRAHTGYVSLDSFLVAGGDPRGRDLDAYVRRTTSFSSFASFEEAAQRAYVARRVFDWLV